MASPQTEPSVTNANAFSEYSFELLQSALLKKKIDEDLSNQTIAKDAGVSEAFVQKVLTNNVQRPSVKNRVRMISYLGLDEPKPYINPIAEEAIELIKAASNRMNDDLLSLMKKHIEYCISFISGGELLVTSLRPPHDKLTDMFPDTGWAFGLRALHDEIVARLPHIPSFRLSIRRDRPLNAYKGYADVEIEVYAKGVEGTGKGDIKVMGTGEALLAKAISEEFPTGGVFNYAEEIKKRNIESPPVVALLVIVPLPHGQRVYVRLDSDPHSYEYTNRDHSVLFSTIQQYLNTQGYMLTPNNNQYYGRLNGA